MADVEPNQTIRDVSQTLLDLLNNNLPDEMQAVLESPKNGEGKVLTLFLYKVLENPDFKNAPGSSVTAGNGKLEEKRAPLTLDLYYLLTAHAKEAELGKAHTALAQAMRVFYDNGVLSGSLLRTHEPPGLTAASTLRLTLNPMTMEDMSRIWSVFPDTPYQISVSYLVTPVPIESTLKQTTAPVVDQFHEHGHRGAELVPTRN
jgi:hypothetical protein